MKSLARREELLVHRLHALFVMRARVLDRLPRPCRRLATQHAARARTSPELGILRIIRILRFLFRVEVIEVAEELVEAVHRRQMFVAIAEVVLAELARRVARATS
jgi:hypothetical protein